MLAAVLSAAGCGDSERDSRSGGNSDAGEGASAGDTGGDGPAATAGAPADGGSGNSDSGTGGSEDAGAAGEPAAAGGAGGTSVCGDQHLDQAAGEECDGGGECSGDCQLLPCPSPGPCLVAERDGSGACVPRAIPNGEPCEDEDPCTADDQCQAGECVGSAIVQNAALQGTVTTFGASPSLDSWNEGIATFVGPDQLVFLESTTYTSSRLSLVEVGAEGLTRLATATSGIGYRADIGWVYRPMTHVVPLNATDFVVLGSHGQSTGVAPQIELFEIAAGQFVSHGFTDMPEDSYEAFGVAAREDALWMCGPLEIQTYTYIEAGKQLILADRFPIVGCSGLAVSPDGQTLFMTRQGIDVIDVSGDPRPGHPSNDAVPTICPDGTAPRDLFSPAPETCKLLAQYFFEDVQVSEDYVAALSTDSVGDSQGVFAISTQDRIVETIPGDGYPIAIALAGDRLFVERSHRTDVWPTLDVMLHSLADPSAEPLAQYVFRDDCCGGEPYTLLSFVAQDDLAVLQPWRRVVRFDAEAQELTPLTDVEHGSLKSVVPAGPDELIAVGPYETHLIDVSSPDAPQILSGGMTLPVGGGDFQLVTPGAGVPPSMVNAAIGFFTPLAQKSTRERFSVLDTSLAPEAMEIGSFWIGSDAEVGIYWGPRLVEGGGWLYQLTEYDDSGITLRRFSTNAGIGMDGEELQPELETVFDDVPADLPLRWEWAVGVSGAGQTLVVLENRYDDDYTQGVWLVSWLAVEGAGLTVLAQTLLQGTDIAEAPQQVLVTGDQALVVGWKGVTRLERDGASVAVAASYLVEDENPSLLNPILARALAFDGERAMLAMHGWIPPAISRWSVELLDADLSTLASYETPEEVLTARVMGTHLVFGMNSAVSVASPVCP